MKSGSFANALALACLAISSQGVIAGGATRELQLTPEDENRFLPVIAVVNKGGPSQAAMDASYVSFRDAYPDRPFCLLQVKPLNNVFVPLDLIRGPNVISRLASRDYGMEFFQSDWFDLCNLYNPVTTHVALLVNVPEIQIKASLNFFGKRSGDAGLQILLATPHSGDNWIKPFARDIDDFGVSPSAQPSATPTNAPSSIPSTLPTNVPSSAPSSQPSASSAPSRLPSGAPSAGPSSAPSGIPSLRPSGSPSSMPSTESNQPSASPSVSLKPSVSLRPSSQPSSAPSLSIEPSQQPSSQPSVKTVSAFNIEGAFSESWLSSFNRDIAKNVFASASQVIVGDIPDATTNGVITLCGKTPTAVDDLWICSNTQALQGGAVSVAGPALVRSDVSGSYFPITGEISIDPSKISTDSELKEVLSRQLQHVLGIGTLWAGPYGYGLATEVSEKCIYDPRSAASLAYQELSGCSTGAPVESDCGEFSGTCFQPDATSTGSTSMMLTSKVTIASLEDMHYTVDYSMANRDEEVDASCKCHQRRGLRHQTPASSSSSTSKPSGRRLSEKGRAEASQIGLRLLRERQAQYLYTRPTFTEKPPLDMSLQVISTVYKEDGAFFSVIVRD